MIDLSKVRAIDVHVHAEVSCHDPEDPVMGRFFDAASAYFKAPRERPKIPEIISLYREQQIAFCLFTVDCESSVGAKRVSNYEIAEYAARNDDIVIPFASIDPRKGRMGAHEARDLIENHGVRGFKFHGIMQDIHPADRVAYPIYEVIAAHKLPQIASILRMEWQIEPQGMAQLHQLSRRRALPQHLLDGIARDDVNHQKDERENEPQRRQREEKSFEEVAHHLA